MGNSLVAAPHKPPSLLFQEDNRTSRQALDQLWSGLVYTASVELYGAARVPGWSHAPTTRWRSAFRRRWPE